MMIHRYYSTSETAPAQEMNLEYLSCRIPVRPEKQRRGGGKIKERAGQKKMQGRYTGKFRESCISAR